MTVRLADAVAFAQVGVVGLDGQIELEALRLCGLPEAAPALLCRAPYLGNAVGPGTGVPPAASCGVTACRRVRDYTDSPF